MEKQINVICYDTHLSSFPTVSLIFTAMKFLHQVISERTKRKNLQP